MTKDIGRLGVHSVESEEALLGAILLDSAQFPPLRDKLSPTDFFELKNGWVWEAFTALADHGAGIDIITVSEELRLKGHLRDAGGAAYLTALVNACATSYHAPEYAAVIRSTSLRRKLMSAVGKIAQLSRESEDRIEVLLPKCELLLLEVTQQSGERAAVKLNAAASAYYDRLEAIYADPSLTLGVPSGIHLVDAALGGWQRTNLYIIAGRPGMGKTALMLTMALGAAQAGIGCVFVSYEMGEEQITNRLYSQITGIPATRIMNGDLQEAEWANIIQARSDMEALPLWIETTPRTVSGIKNTVKRIHAEYPVGLVIVDYLQLVPSRRVSREQSREVEVSEIARGLKQMAQGMRIPVLAASQLSRRVEDRQNKRPQLADLRESGEIEQAADAVIMLYRDDYYNKNSERPGVLEWIVAKNRHGATETIDLVWDAPRMRVLNGRTEVVYLNQQRGMK